MESGNWDAQIKTQAVQVTDKLDHKVVTSYDFKKATFVVIGTDYKGRSNYMYHPITSTTTLRGHMTITFKVSKVYYGAS